MDSSAMAVVSASFFWMSRDSRRTAAPKYLTENATGGTTARMSSVSRQFSITISASEPTSVSESRSADARSRVATVCTLETSFVRRLVISPVRWSEKKLSPSPCRCR